MLHYAVRAGLLDENVAVGVPNPEPKRREVPSFETMEDVEAVAVELGPRFGAIPIVAALPACARRNGSRSNAETSTGKPGSCTSAASTPMGR